jgi:hypothetical protein
MYSITILIIYFTELEVGNIICIFLWSINMGYLIYLFINWLYNILLLMDYSIVYIV